jgi:hypothetical protein
MKIVSRELFTKGLKQNVFVTKTTSISKSYMISKCSFQQRDAKISFTLSTSFSEVEIAKTISNIPGRKQSR